MKKFLWRWLKRLIWLGLGFVFLSVLLVWSLTKVDPPTSAFMLARQWQARADEKFELRHDWVAFKSIAPHAPVAFIAAEDQKFALHHGFDLDAIEKAMDHNANANGKRARVRGASTISQQVAKNLFLWSGRSYLRKGFEAYFTLLIEWLWPKQRIIEVYANVAEFGDGVYGVESAAKTFFKKPAAKLSPRESAMLAAVLPNPKKFIVNKPTRYQQQRVRWIERQARQLGGPSYLQYLQDPSPLQAQLDRVEKQKQKRAKSRR